MRTLLTFLIVLGVAAGAGAQTIGLPLAPIGLPLPEIGLPLPATGLPPLHAIPPAPARPSSPPVNHRSPNDGRAGRGARGFVYFVPAYGWDALGASLPGPPSPPPIELSPPPMGHLDVDVQQDANPQVFMDGAFVGALDDVGGELVLTPGIHRLELRADEYLPLVVDVQIVADRTTRYRGTLIGGSASQDSVLGGTRPTTEIPAPSTIYMIPGCYVGNLPPREVSLPAGCDPASVVVFPSSK